MFNEQNTFLFFVGAVDWYLVVAGVYGGGCYLLAERQLP